MDTERKFISDFDISSDYEVSEERLIADIANAESRIKELNDELCAWENKRKQLLASLSEYAPEIKIPPIELAVPTTSIQDLIANGSRGKFCLEFFRGRRDVFAERCWNKKTGKIVYYPKCDNRWSPVCPLTTRNANDKRRGCKDCNVRNYRALTGAEIESRNIHNDNERGLGAVGIYMMHPDNMCYFSVIDLDESSWKEDAKAILAISRSAGFAMAIERSFSGNGAHLWLFFSEPVPAVKARRLMKGFIDEASLKYKMISMSSYDRIFPTQDSLEGKGLGNLILLPFVFSAGRRECTVFLDDEFKRYKDQYAYLSALPKHSNSEIDEYIRKISSSYNRDSNLLSIFEEEDIEPLWKRSLPDVHVGDFKDDLVLYKGSGITIAKDVLSRKALLFLRKLTSFPNPEYYENSRKYLSYYSKEIPATLSCSEERANAFWLPRGFEDFLEGYLRQHNIPFSCKNHRVFNKVVHAEFKGELRPRQKPALSALTKENSGILKAGTGFGKSVVAAALIAERKCSTLVLVPSTALLKQWKDSLLDFLILHDEVSKDRRKRNNKGGIGTLGGQTTDCMTGLVDVAMIQTIAARCKDERPAFLDDYEMVIVDECHHIAADSFLIAIKNLRPKYIYGLSATVKRRDGLEKLVYASCGKVLFEYDAKTMAEENGIEQFFIPRFTYAEYNEAYFNNNNANKIIAFNEKRNALIVSDIKKAFEDGRRILVLTKLIEHTEILQKMLELPSVVLHGQLGSKEFRKRMEEIKDEKFSKVIISTSKLMGEGTDIPFLDTLFLAAPASYEGLITQFAGRISRRYDGKVNTFIYDYVDIKIRPFELMYMKRLRAYKILGYRVFGDTASYQRRCLFSSYDFITPLTKSFTEARKMITISSSHLNPSRVTKGLIQELQAAMDRGVKVFIITNRYESKPGYEDLEERTQDLFKEFDVLYKNTDSVNFAVIDNIEVWYGSNSFLSYPSKDKVYDNTVLRFFDEKVARELESIANTLVL